jgi:hypothetical protein
MRLALFASFSLLILAACADGTPPTPRMDGGPRDGGGDTSLPDVPGLDVPGLDAPVLPGEDAPVIPPDVPPGFDAGSDAGVPSTDAPVVGTGAYLDRCTGNGDCASGRCVLDRGGTRFCSRACTSDLMCAHEHLCAGSFCVPDTTGAPCSVGAPDGCASGLCIGSAAGGSCTRFCSSAAECPAGYACSIAGGSTAPICVEIEKPCTASGSECASGLCIPGLGCTATCTSAAMCPARLGGLPPYTCARDFGSTTNICVPPADILGDDAIGASCPFSGTSECRSGACDTSAPLGPMCTQTCAAQGGCPAGFGCYPLEDPPGTITLVCERAGGLDLGATCTSGRLCSSGICQAPGYCTRLCADGFCPTGYRCAVAAGTALCERL